MGDLLCHLVWRSTPCPGDRLDWSWTWASCSRTAGEAGDCRTGLAADWRPVECDGLNRPPYCSPKSWPEQLIRVVAWNTYDRTCCWRSTSLRAIARASCAGLKHWPPAGAPCPLLALTGHSASVLGYKTCFDH